MRQSVTLKPPDVLRPSGKSCLCFFPPRCLRLSLRPHAAERGQEPGPVQRFYRSAEAPCGRRRRKASALRRVGQIPKFRMIIWRRRDVSDRLFWQHYRDIFMVRSIGVRALLWFSLIKNGTTLHSSLEKYRKRWRVRPHSGYGPWVVFMFITVVYISNGQTGDDQFDGGAPENQLITIIYYKKNIIF